MNNKIKNLEIELEKLQKKREQERKKKELKTRIWVLKHPRLVLAGEKTRYGLGKLHIGLKATLKKMKEKEEMERKKTPKFPQESYAQRLNKALQ